MRKVTQKFMNEICKERYQEAMDELYANGLDPKAKKLRSCQARVYETATFYILESYSTIVAFIDKDIDTLYDVLRYTYGYTATSAQHISKFEKDYCTGKWSCADRLTYREV